MSNLIRQGDANLAAFGQLGGKFLYGDQTQYGSIDVSSQSYRIVAIQSLDDSTYLKGPEDTLSEFDNPADHNDNGRNLAALENSNYTIPKGVIIYGRWKKVSLGSANSKAIVYFG